jgi:RNA polymerase sigma factor (sigma-70 family)
MGQVGSGPYSLRTSEFLAVQEVALRRLRGHAMPLVRSHAEDLAMDVVASFATSRERKQIDNVEAWATTAARNAASDFLDLKANARPGFEIDAEARDDGPSEAAGEALDRLVDPGGSPSRRVFTRDQAARLLSALSAKQQLLVIASAEGVPQAEIASLLGYRSANSVKSALTDVRRKIEGLAAELGIDPAWNSWP